MGSQGNNNGASLFPMRLSSIEKFHLFTSSNSHPNDVFCRLLVAGQIDSAIAREAWQCVKLRHVFSLAHVSEISGVAQWEFEPDNCNSDTATVNDFDSIFLSEKPSGWNVPPSFRDRIKLGPYFFSRSWNEDGKIRTEVWFCVHHAKSDGVGAVQFVNDWIQIYVNLANGKRADSDLKQLNPGLLLNRNRLGLLTWAFLKRLPFQLIGIFGAAKFILRKPFNPYHNKQSSGPSVQFPTIVSSWLSEDALSDIEGQAKRAGVSLNSILMGKLFCSLSAWQTEMFPHFKQNSWIRMILPMHIRSFADRRMPAANRTSIVQIDCNQRMMNNTSRLYYLIDREIRLIRHWKIDRMFLVIVRCLSLFSIWLRLAAKNSRTWGLVVFTNLGRPLRILEKRRMQTDGAFPQLIEFDCIGPLRQGTPFNFSFAQYLGRLRITLHYDSNCLKKQEAQHLLDQLCQQLKMENADIG